MSTPDDLLQQAIDLLTPGKWAREHGYEVPTGDEWDAARIRLLQAVGEHDLAEHLLAAKIAMLEAFDWSDNTKRVIAFQEAIQRPSRPRSSRRRPNRAAATAPGRSSCSVFGTASRAERRTASRRRDGGGSKSR